MSRRARLLMLAIAVAVSHATLLDAQSIRIFSEFQRPDPFGEIVPVDRSQSPREILSPAVARNAYASFHVVVTAPANTNYLLYAGLKPLNACRVDIYKEHFVKTAKGWIPDALTPLRQLPDFGAIPDPDDGVAGQTTRAYLLDLWIPPDAPVARFRVELQLKIGTFEVAPMEVRIVPGSVPALATSKAEKQGPRAGGEAAGDDLPGVESRADASAIGALKRYLAGQPQVAPAEPMTVRAIILRNAVQDMALAGALDPKRAGPDALRARWFGLAWQAAPRTMGAEWYLKLRDFLYAASGK